MLHDGRAAEVAHRALASDERRNAQTFGNKRRSGQVVGDEAIEFASPYCRVVVGRRRLPGGAPGVQMATQTISELSDLPSHTNTIARLGEQIQRIA